MAITKKGRTTVLVLVGAGLISAGGCGDSPTAVRNPSAAAVHDAQVECYVIDGQIHCNTSGHIKQDSIQKP